MAHEQIRSVLQAVETGSIEIERVVLLKFGALSFAEELPDESDPNQFSAQESIDEPDWTPPSGLVEKMRNVLADHPNVFHIRTLNSSSHEAFYGSRSGMLATGPLFGFEINLPRGRQQYQDMDGAESFTVLCNGSFFAAYTIIDDIPVYSNIGHEFRVLAREQINAKTSYRVPHFGPTPIWDNV